MIKAEMHSDGARCVRIDAALLYAGLGLVVALTASFCALAIGIKLSRSERPEAADVVLNDLAIRVPSGWVRGRPLPAQARVWSLALSIPFDELVRSGSADGPVRSTVLVSLNAADGAPPPEERPALLYARFLDHSVAHAEGGLIRRAFRPGSPFENEVLYLAPPDGRRFAARCLAERGEADASCLAEFRLSGLDIRATFPQGLLPRWEALTAALGVPSGALFGLPPRVGAVGYAAASPSSR